MQPENSKKTLDSFLNSLTTSVKQFDLKETENVLVKMTAYLRDNVATHPKSFLKELTSKLVAEDFVEVERLVNQLLTKLQSGAADYTSAESKAVLKVLKKHRQFGYMPSVADAFMSTGLTGGDTDSISVELLYAQALIENGNIQAAIALLENSQAYIEELSASERTGFMEQEAECAGILGRAYKQLFVVNFESGNRKGAEENLNQSIEEYSKIYDSNKFKDYSDKTWHGINLASLIERAKKEKFKLQTKKAADGPKIAEEILTSLESRVGTPQEIARWDKGTMLEAKLLLGHRQSALQDAVEYCRSHEDKFKYGSTLRQLHEILQLDKDDKVNAKILSWLQAMQLQNEDGSKVVVSDLAQQEQIIDELLQDGEFEARFESEYNTLKWWRLGMKCTKSVGKIVNRLGELKGTGFVVRGNKIHDDLNDDLVLLTNSHVISNDLSEQTGADPRSLEIEKASVIFSAVDSSKSYKFKELYRNSHRNNLDYSVLLLDEQPAGIEPLDVNLRHPREDGRQRLYIIGHPENAAGEIAFSHQNNKILGYSTVGGEKKKVKYRAPTEPGSSGSPVFNAEWEVFAVHHKTYDEANWAILMSAIVADSAP